MKNIYFTDVEQARIIMAGVGLTLTCFGSVEPKKPGENYPSVGDKHPMPLSVGSVKTIGTFTAECEEEPEIREYHDKLAARATECGVLVV